MTAEIINLEEIRKKKQQNLLLSSNQRPTDDKQIKGVQSNTSQSVHKEYQTPNREPTFFLSRKLAWSTPERPKRVC